MKACASVPRVLGGLRLCIPSPRRGVGINSDMNITAGGGGYHLRSRSSQYAVSMKDRDRQYSRRPLCAACWVPGTVAARGTHRRWLRTIEQRSVHRHGSEARAAITRYKVGLTTLMVQDSRFKTAQRGNTTQTRDPGEHHRPPHNSAKCSSGMSTQRAIQRTSPRIPQP